MKNLVVFAAVALGGASLFGATSTPEGWTDDYNAALKQAAAEKKTVLVDFSGSDWCGWCKRLDKEVFDTEVFKQGVKDKFVLLFIDSPKDKSKLSEVAKKNNRNLCKKYKVKGFPTVLLLNEKGEQIGETGYQQGGPEKYLQHLDSLLEKAAKKGSEPGAKEIAAIEAVLNAPDEKLKEEMMSMQSVLEAKFPRPAKDASAEVKAEFKKNVEREGRKIMFAIIDKYIPIYEKAFEEAKGMKVPAEAESRKKELIEGQEQNFNAMKQMHAMMKASAQE